MLRTRFKTKFTLASAILGLFACIALLISSLSFFVTKGRLKLPTGPHAPAISLGERHGLILASDGSLWSWGSDFLGWPVLGLSNAVSHTTSLRRIGNDTNWVSISASESHNLALKSDGTLWTWGQSVRPRAGGLRPIPTPVPAAPGNDWKQAAAGGIHCLAIKTNGTLWAWGNNWAGSVGIANTNGSAMPVQVGSATNWVKVWASLLESVALQSDGSLWYWGENPDSAFKQDIGRIVEPTRVNQDTDWVDVGFGVDTAFAIKSNGTLWAWGRNADVYTISPLPEPQRPDGDRVPPGPLPEGEGLVRGNRASTLFLSSGPIRVGTGSDWQSISRVAGWWCLGLIKKDGSLWLMDASDSKPNGPRTPYKPVQFRRMDFQKPCAAYAAGAVHAAGAGIHGAIAVFLTPDGEVWTSGMILGDPATLGFRLQTGIAKAANFLHLKVPSPDPPPIFKNKPWQLESE